MSRSQRGGLRGRKNGLPPHAAWPRSGASEVFFEGIFETAFNHIPAALAVSDIETSKILDANQFFVELVGYPREKLIGQSSHELNIWPDWDERNRVAGELVRNGYLRNVEVKMRTAGGEVLDILASFDLIYLRRRPCVLGMAVDITQRKRHEAQLQEALKLADAANCAKSEFLANVSHEMRTPLTAIKGFAEILSQTLTPDAQGLQYLERLRCNVAHLSRLIDDTLDLAKVEAGRLDTQITVVDARSLTEAIMGSFELEFRSKGIDLTLLWDEAAPIHVMTDSKLFRQIVSNLLSNALRFTERGMVGLVVSREQAGGLSLLVNDTGCGVAAADWERIFEPFSQADASYTRRVGGTGLGLTLARRMARALGGDVTLEGSEIGVGSQFRVRLPGQLLEGNTGRGSGPSASVMIDEAPRGIERDALCGVHVLVVEDGSDNRQVIAHFLQNSGAKVSFAENGEEAVEQALAKKFDLILMDIQMPVLDGYEAARRLKDAGCWVPIIMLTAAALEEERRRCLALGCQGYLTKPFEAVTLVDQVRAALQSARSQVDS